MIHQKKTTQINIEWRGGYSVEEIKNFQGENHCGLYQIYGAHPIYGSNVLLYIGKVSYQDFETRIQQHKNDIWAYNQDSKNISIYIGYLGGNKEVSDNQWDKEITMAEKLLIFTHKPAYNSLNIKTVKDVDIGLHILNWGSYRSLMPEVSAFRYLFNNDEHFVGYKLYGE